MSTWSLHILLHKPSIHSSFNKVVNTSEFGTLDNIPEAQIIFNHPTKDLLQVTLSESTTNTPFDNTVPSTIHLLRTETYMKEGLFSSETPLKIHIKEIRKIVLPKFMKVSGTIYSEIHEYIKGILRHPQSRFEAWIRNYSSRSLFNTLERIYRLTGIDYGDLKAWYDVCSVEHSTWFACLETIPASKVYVDDPA